MAEHEVTSRFTSDNGIVVTMSAEHAVRIRIEVYHFKNRQVSNSGESRPIACADNFCHWGSFRPWLRLLLSLGIPFRVLIAGQPNFISTVMGVAATPPQFSWQRK